MSDHRGGMSTAMAACAIAATLFVVAGVILVQNQNLAELRQSVGVLQQQSAKTETVVAEVAAGVPDNGQVSVYTNTQYGFRAVTTKDCVGQFTMKASRLYPAEAAASYGVYVPKSKTWPASELWYFYSVMTQKAFNEFLTPDRDGLSEDKPKIVMVLKGGNLLTYFSPQDGPQDINNCVLKVEAL